ncbi:MAG: SDR family NAD(P)-dependent oxidoreductase [Deltaproteobacteria bacterium]|nr:SDR family NAD(P)-dependent oxidoreductase [Deltaproteobacteria bacterium]
MNDFRGKLAVITGGGTGMGRELARQLAAEGCHLALCDVSVATMTETKALCEAEAPAGTRVSIQCCDVSAEEQVLAFRAAVQAAHATDRIQLLFNNAGIGGGGSMIADDRAEWDKTFGVCWGGVYFCTRAFLPMLIASDEAVIVNTSSVNGFWACLGPRTAHTAYSAAKFAVKGFSEALITDLRLHAPHVKVSVVMPGHIGTSIVMNTNRVLRNGDIGSMSAEDVARLRGMLSLRGLPVDAMSDDELRAAMEQIAIMFRDHAPTTAARAATIILDGVRAGEWRILVGEDAVALDRAVRAEPAIAYEERFAQALQAEGHMRLIG